MVAYPPQYSVQLWYSHLGGGLRKIMVLYLFQALRSGYHDGSNLKMSTNHRSLRHYLIEKAGVGQNILAVTTDDNVHYQVDRRQICRVVT